MKVNGAIIANGCVDDEDESDSDPGEMPPLPAMKVSQQSWYKCYLYMYIFYIVLRANLLTFTKFFTYCATVGIDRRRSERT